MALASALTVAMCFRLGAQQPSLAELKNHLDRAQVCLDQAQYAEAAAELQAALAINPQLRGANYQRGFALFQLGQYPAAAQAFERELRFEPPDPYSLYYLGRIRLAAGRRAEAIALLEKSLAAGEVLDVRQKLASSYVTAGRVNDAIRFLRASLRVRVEDGGLHYLLGRAYQQQGDTKNAAVEFAAAARWKGKQLQELQALTRLHQRLNAHDRAGALGAAAEAGGSRDPDVLMAAATALGQSGFHQQAVPLLEKTIAIQPDLPEAHYDLARALVALNEREKAQAELQRATELKPDFYEACVLLGALLADAGRSEAAIRYLRAAAAVRSDDPRLLMTLGLQYFQQRYYPDAIDVLSKAIRLDPGHPDSRFLLIQALYRNLEYERALALAKETRDRFPDNALAYFHVAAQLNNFGMLAEAKEQLSLALAKDPKLIEARAMMGDVLFKMGDAEASLAEYRQVLAADPNFMDAHVGIGKALIQLKRFPEAAAAMQEAIRIHADVPSLHLFLSQAYRGLGRAADARDEVEVFTRLNRARAEARDKDVERKYEN